MCQQLTVLERNEFKQAIFICEHDTIHLVCQYTTMVMTRHAFYKLNQFLQSRCSNKEQGALCCKMSSDNNVELWIGKGAFRLIPAELISLATLIEKTTRRLKDVPLEELLAKAEPKLSKPMDIDFSQN